MAAGDTLILPFIAKDASGIAIEGVPVQFQIYDSEVVGRAYGLLADALTYTCCTDTSAVYADVDANGVATPEENIGIAFTNYYNIITEQLHSVVVGRSNIVGKPIASLLSSRSEKGNSTVTICHSRTSNLSYFTQQADILIAAIGMNEFIDDNPDRFFQVGIAEANMMGIAAGMTIGGKIPFTGTFANFSTSRV